MKKWNMIIDVAECTNCQSVHASAMDEYVGNEWPGYSAPMPRHGHRWIDIKQKERGQVPMIDVAYVPTMCNHCDNAPCLAKGGDAVTKRDDGIVIIDPVKAKGRKDLVETCPYGHIWWNEELQLPQIWTFDAHLLDQGWQQTRGQQACPTGAMRAIKVEDDEMARIAREQELEVMKPEAGTKPRVYYRNLWRYSKCFIGGSVSAEANGAVDCVEGATVRLLKDGAPVATDDHRQLRGLQVRPAGRGIRPLCRRNLRPWPQQDGRSHPGREPESGGNPPVNRVLGRLRQAGTRFTLG